MNKLLTSIFLLIAILNFGISQGNIDLATEISTIENGLLSGILIKGDEVTKMNIHDRMAVHNVPGASIAIVKNGKIHWAKSYGIANSISGTKVKSNTIFQAGSISKPVAALAALKLAEEGKLDLDANVNNYLKKWKLPNNRFTDKVPVTTRHLLTHTGGLTVHGFPGYKPKDKFPSDIEVLNGLGNTSAIFVDTIPGSIWRYSGGGYTIMENIVEDITGLPFEEYMRQYILEPMKMTMSTYAQPLPVQVHGDASAAYNSEGIIIEGEYHNYPEQAAAGLWTTPTDLAKYCIHVQEILSGKSAGILTKESIKAMTTKHLGDWGLGPGLKWEADSLIFQHGGKNAGFTNNMMAFAYKGEAVIVMTNADNGGRLIGEILRSASNYYDWGIAESRVVDILDIPIEELQKFTGNYKYIEKVPGIGDYIFTITIKNQKLLLHDNPENRDHTIQPVEPLKFIDVVSSDNIDFDLDEEGKITSLLWNGRFKFVKVEEEK